ncbi:MAG: Unknown protein [uncultured Sulfurovum sp.]|uniref:Metallo-beta-lactamase domain-containing protein n=1 Tax=uncultured Sulfurovum sp. TaxID=269237 RepID=A0A6S6TE39_9BACT|nr:MAG: Unknown protein [uncultured Sulfurovum sp.]
MITVELIQAAQGDSIWIEYGETIDSLHRILIDGGTNATYKTLKKRIEALPPFARHFDLLVITHIDADHIAGVLKLFEDTTLGLTFSDIWFNGYKHLSNTTARGVKQAEKLTTYLEQNNIPWNRAFQGKSVCIPKNNKPLILTLDGGMELTLFSPTRKALAKLKPKWTKELIKSGLLPGPSALSHVEPTQSTRAPRTLLPDVESLARTSFKSDTSLTNGSSIAFLASYDDKKMLFSGDAYATTLLDSIKKYLPKCEPLYLDLFKVPHHGSDCNISKQLLEHIRCNKYLISANGAYHHHPDDVAIAKIITYGGHMSNIYFNYISDYNQIWKDQELQKNHCYHAHYPKKEDTSITINL